MPGRGPLENPGQVAAGVGELTSSAWVLSALATVQGREIDSPFPRDDPAARVLVSYEFFEQTDDGLVPTPRWQVHLWDGTLMSEDERAWLGEDVGFSPPVPIDSPPGAPLLVAVRRPQ